MLRELLGSHQQSHQASPLLRESVILVSYLLVVKGHAERTVRISSASHQASPLLRESVILVSYLLVVKGHAERTVRISSAVSPGLSSPERVCDSSELPTGGQRAC